MSKYLWKEIDSDLDKIMSKCEHIERNEDRKRIYFVGRTFKNAKIIVHFRRKNSLTRKEMITDICILDEVRNRFSFSVCFFLCLPVSVCVCLSASLSFSLSPFLFLCPVLKDDIDCLRLDTLKKEKNKLIPWKEF